MKHPLKKLAKVVEDRPFVVVWLTSAGDMNLNYNGQNGGLAMPAMSEALALASKRLGRVGNDLEGEQQA